MIYSTEKCGIQINSTRAARIFTPLVLLIPNTIVFHAIISPNKYLIYILKPQKITSQFIMVFNYHFIAEFYSNTLYLPLLFRLLGIGRAPSNNNNAVCI